MPGSEEIQFFRDLGCNVIELFSEPDGRFPNHHPNPSDPSNLEQIKRAVLDNKADFGIAFDGDSDRIGVVDSKGEQLTGDKLLLIYLRFTKKLVYRKGFRKLVRFFDEMLMKWTL